MRFNWNLVVPASQISDGQQFLGCCDGSPNCRYKYLLGRNVLGYFCFHATFKSRGSTIKRRRPFAASVTAKTLHHDLMLWCAATRSMYGYISIFEKRLAVDLGRARSVSSYALLSEIHRYASAILLSPLLFFTIFSGSMSPTRGVYSGRAFSLLWEITLAGQIPSPCTGTSWMALVTTPLSFRDVLVGNFPPFCTNMRAGPIPSP